jgi:hypothetical protein
MCCSSLVVHVGECMADVSELGMPVPCAFTSPDKMPRPGFDGSARRTVGVIGWSSMCIDQPVRAASCSPLFGSRVGREILIQCLNDCRGFGGGARQAVVERTGGGPPAEVSMPKCSNTSAARKSAATMRDGGASRGRRSSCVLPRLWSRAADRATRSQTFDSYQVSKLSSCRSSMTGVIFATTQARRRRHS